MSQRERDIDVLARTIWGEARGEGEAGQIAVGWCIRNRVEIDLRNDGKPDWWGEGYEGVCKAKWQFSCWNLNDPNSAYLRGEKTIPAAQYVRCREVALAVIDGHRPDPTGQATHYYNPKAVTRTPAWAPVSTFTVKIGAHLFFKDVP